MGPRPRHAGINPGDVWSLDVCEQNCVVIFSGSINRLLDERAARGADSTPAVAQASAELDSGRQAPAASVRKRSLSRAVNIAPRRPARRSTSPAFPAPGPKHERRRTFSRTPSDSWITPWPTRAARPPAPTSSAPRWSRHHDRGQACRSSRGRRNTVGRAAIGQFPVRRRSADRDRPRAAAPPSHRGARGAGAGAIGARFRADARVCPQKLRTTCPRWPKATPWSRAARAPR